MLKPIWVATGIVILISILFQLPQLLEVLSEVTRDDAGRFWHQLWLFVGALSVAGTGWYFPRGLLYTMYWNTPVPKDAQEPARFDWFRSWVPRALGLLPLVSLAIAFARQDRLGFAAKWLCLSLQWIGAGFDYCRVGHQTVVRRRLSCDCLLCEAME